MGIFNIKIKKIEVKDDVKLDVKDWEVNYLNSSRKDKTCAYCGQPILRDQKNTSFTKRTVINGTQSKWDSKYTHGHATALCTIKYAQYMGIKLI